MADLIQPRTLKGFRDYLPALMIPRERLMEKAREVYRSYGFAPIDTPALEFAEILLGKGGEESDKQMYRFQHDRHDVALRFDLTVPFARFAAQHIGQLGTPFKRYHLGPVWRGENTQKGRYREFWQCDFDTIGTTSNASDTETALVIHDLMRALGFERFEVRINNRLILNGLLEELKIAQQGAAVLRCLDKLGKVTSEAVRRELVGASEEQADRILCFVKEKAEELIPLPNTIAEVEQTVKDFVHQLEPLLNELGAFHLRTISLEAINALFESAPLRLRKKLVDSQAEMELRRTIVGVGLMPEQADSILALVGTEGTNSQILERLNRDFGGNIKTAEGIARLRELLDVCRAAGVPEGKLRLDLSIARGLDYYTGTVFETFLLDLPKIGSVCSGGRYDNLAELYTKQQLPGVGASLGLDRLLAAMEELNLLPKVATAAPVLMVQFDADRLGDYQCMARTLRAAGIGVELYPEAKKVGQQLKYAEARGFRIALIAGGDEFAQGVWKLKDLAARAETTVPAAGVAEAVRALLAKG
jgi:histidyl-tRNA synthetase